MMRLAHGAQTPKACMGLRDERRETRGAMSNNLASLSILMVRAMPTQPTDAASGKMLYPRNRPAICWHACVPPSQSSR